jgi:hypothetical protein
MNSFELQYAIRLLENLREELLTAKLRDQCRVLDTSDMRAWLEEKIDRLRSQEFN